MKQFCQYCHFTADFADYKAVQMTRTINDHETNEPRTMVYISKVYQGQAVYIENKKPVCLPCAVMGRYDVEKIEYPKDTPKS